MLLLLISISLLIKIIYDIITDMLWGHIILYRGAILSQNVERARDWLADDVLNTAHLKDVYK